MPQPGVSTSVTSVAATVTDTPGAMAGTSISGAVVLPSVSTILAPTSSCSVNAALISVLSVPEASLAAIPLQTGAESAAFDTAEDADSESQEGETDPPGYKNCGSY